ncbi:MAG: chromate transporter, partial [Pseudolabrys sp.]|nr:chromate transporter [Pseudolabrys sp.]
PGAFVMLGLSLLYAYGRGFGPIDGALFGIKAAVLVIVVEALIRIGKRALKSRLLIGLAAAAFVGIFFLDLPFPLIVIGAGAVGFLVARTYPERLGVAANDNVVAPTEGRWRQAATSILVGLAIWWAPVAIAAIVLGPHHVMVSIGLFFSKLAVVTFGGAYAVLADMAQQAV